MTPPKRATYIEVGQAMRQSIDRANAAGATDAEMRILQAVHYYLVSYSRLSDHRTLAQLARAAGLTSDPNPQRWITKKVAARLQALAAAGAIYYQPSAGRGYSSYIALPSPEKGAEATPLSGEEKGAVRAPLPSREKGASRGPKREPVEVQKGARGGPKREPVEVQKGSPHGSPREETSEEVFRGRSTSRIRERSQPRPHQPTPPDPGGLPAGPQPAPAADPEPPEWHTRLWTAIHPGDDTDPATLTETLTIHDHLTAHLNPDTIWDLIHQLEEDPPTRPRNALRAARATARQWGTELPRLDLPAST